MRAVALATRLVLLRRGVSSKSRHLVEIGNCVPFMITCFTGSFQGSWQLAGPAVAGLKLNLCLEPKIVPKSQLNTPDRSMSLVCVA
jgi:hypothetical protein